MKRLRCSDGFTLVEMMMAILVMTVGLLGLLQAVIVAFETKAKNALREQSYRIAEGELNELALKSYDLLSTSYTAKKYPAAFTGFTTFTVERGSTPISANSKKISVQVKWASKGAPVNHEIYTIKTR